MGDLTKQYKAVGRKVVKVALAKGYVVSVFDGEAYPVKRSKDLKEIVDALCSTDEDLLVVRNADGKLVGSIYLVYGNLPEETVADYTANDEIEDIVKVAGF